MTRARPRLVAWVLALASCSAPRAWSVRADDDAPAAARQQVASGAPQDTAPAQSPVPVAEVPVLDERHGGRHEGLKKHPREWLETRLHWDRGPRLDAFAGDLTLVLGGRLQLDAAAFSESQAITDEFGPPDPGAVVRRAYVNLGAVALDHLEFLVQYDFASGGEFKELYAGVFDLPTVGRLRAGYTKEPFGLEYYGSSNDITFMERGLASALIVNRGVGVIVNGNLTKERLSTGALGWFRDSNGDLETTDGWGLTGRATVLPVYEREGRRLLHLGLSASLRHASNDELRFRTRPESYLAQYLADTGQFAASSDVRLGLEAAAVLDSVSFQSELVLASVDGVGEVGDPLFPAGYVMASYVLTGEHRRYRRNIGVFGRVLPEHESGAVELAMRSSYIDLDSVGVEGGSLFDVTTGVNWYLNDYVRLMFNYVAARPGGFGTEHILQARFQVAL